MVALFDFQMSRFIIDIVLGEEKANEFCLPSLTEIEVLIPANADEKGLSDKGDKTEPLTTTPRFLSRFPTADSCCNTTDSYIQLLERFVESICPLPDSYNF
jgi:hypothetical protein